MTEPRPQLDYAAAPPLYRRRAVRRAAVAIAVLVLLGVCYYCLKPIPGRVRMLVLQRRAAAVAYPPTQVAWEEDPDRIAAWTSGAASGPDWATFRDQGRVQAAYLVPPALRGLLEIPGGGYSALYAGMRDGGSGGRIVVIAAAGGANRFVRPSGRLVGPDIVRVITLRPATLASDARVWMSAWAGRGILDQIPAGQLRLYWGQPDPADAARFTIRFESPLTSGTIDGRLMPDDTVQFKVVPNPTTAPSK